MAKIHISKEELKKILKIGGLCVSPSRVVPMSEYVRITTKGKRIKIEATNSLTSIKTYTDIDIETEDMSFCVNYKDFSSYVSAVSDDEITLDVNTESNSITIMHTEGELTLSCVNAKDFPDFENAGEDASAGLQIASEVISKWIARAKDFVSDDEIRPTLCGANICGESGKLTISASDSKILLYDETVNENVTDNFGIIIASGAFNAISALIDGTESFTLKHNGLKAWFTVGSTTLSVVLTAGKYPNVKSVIPSTFEHDVTVSKKSLCDSLRRIGLVVSNTFLLKFAFSEAGVLSIVHENLSEAKKASETVAYKGSMDFTVGFSYKALTKALNAIDGEDVIFRLTDAKKAVVLAEGDSESKKVVLVMPVLV